MICQMLGTMNEYRTEQQIANILTIYAYTNQTMIDEKSVRKTPATSILVVK